MLYLYHRKRQRQRTHLRNYNLCDPVKICCYWTLSSRGVIKSPIGRVPIITQTFDRIRLCFRMKVRFSDAFLVSHIINQRQRMHWIYMLLLLTRVMWRSRSQSSFWLSGHLFLAIQLRVYPSQLWSGTDQPGKRRPMWSVCIRWLHNSHWKKTKFAITYFGRP